MLLWLGLAVMTGAAILFLVRPLLRKTAPVRPRNAFDLAVWRDQLDELRRDVERGVLSEAEAASARLEIERRVLRTATPIAETAAATPRAVRFIALATSLFVPALALILYLRLGAPGIPDEPLTAREGETALLRADGSLDLAKARQGIEEKLREHPDSVQGWLLLARTDGALGDWTGAHSAFDRALLLSKRDPAMLESYGDLLVSEGQGTVTPQAQAIFQEAAAAPTSFRARYYLALAKAQQGDLPGAVADWRALEKSAPPDAPWLENVRNVIAEAERQQATPNAPAADTAAKPPPEMAAIMSMPPEQRIEAIRSMVAGLAARLQQQPDDLEGWKRLGRSYGVLGEAKLAADAYGHAAALSPKDVGLLVDQAQAVQGIEPENAPIAPAAVEIYRKVAAIDPDQVQALWFLGLAARQAGRKDEAVADWQRLLKQLKPDSLEAAEVKKQLASLGAAD
jgi:cytochrome c-type biogenesis protein CcmH